MDKPEKLPERIWVWKTLIGKILRCRENCINSPYSGAKLYIPAISEQESAGKMRRFIEKLADETEPQEADFEGEHIGIDKWVPTFAAKKAKLFLAVLNESNVKKEKEAGEDAGEDEVML